VIRHLNANGKGPVRVVARHASTEDLGTVWDTIDRCDGTEVRVKRGAVKVTDLIRHKTRKVTAGHAIVVRP
jgi:ferric-dicitrate binding protein FerR (iron transport regulator)